ncbi:MAG: hypothetical protein JW814_05885 [Candidatus Krumholzibacteriota bacterium]|nr:hypothetical protein [Candidatus Krumholzibacteriota bacterium]
MGKKCLKSAIVLLALFCPIFISEILYGVTTGESVSDSTADFHCAAVYTNRIMLMKESDPYPWNDPENESHLNDRLSLLFQFTRFRDVRFFLKGASGVRDERTGKHRNRLLLEQGDIRYRLAGEGLGVRLFMRERIFRTRNRELNLISDDIPEISGKGQGIALDAKAWGHLYLRLGSADFYETSQIERKAGLPLFSDAGDEMDWIEIEAGGKRWHAGFILAENRSSIKGNRSIAGVTAGKGIGTAMLQIEFVRSIKGRAQDLWRLGLPDIDSERISFGEVSRGLPDDMAFQTEVTGIERRFEGIGKLGVVPSYRYSGNDYSWEKGELAPGTVESNITSWWKHDELALSVFMEASDLYSGPPGERCRSLSTVLRTEFKKGFESREKMILAEGRKPVFLFSLLDDRYGSRMRFMTRIDDYGGRNEFYFLAEGGIDLDSSWSIRSTLFHHGKGESFYNAELEYRPQKRFLFRAGFGSFDPACESISIWNDPVPREVEKQRMISFYTRIWLGEIID